MNQSEDRVRDESEDPNGDDGGDDAIRSEKSLRDQDEAADAALGRYDFGHDQVGPGPAHRDAQRIAHLREGGGQEYLVEDLPARGTKRVGDLEHLVRDTMSDVHHHQHELKEDANPDDDELFVFVEADEQDEQWDEGRRRHIADEGDRRLEERSHDLERSHQQAQWYRHQGGDQKAGDDPEGAPPNIGQEAPVQNHVDPGRHDSTGTGSKEGIVDGGRCQTPDDKDDDKTADAKRNHGRAGNRLLGRQVGTKQPAAPALHSGGTSRRRLGRRDPLAHESLQAVDETGIDRIARIHGRVDLALGLPEIGRRLHVVVDLAVAAAGGG